MNKQKHVTIIAASIMLFLGAGLFTGWRSDYNHGIIKNPPFYTLSIQLTFAADEAYVLGYFTKNAIVVFCTG